MPRGQISFNANFQHLTESLRGHLTGCPFEKCELTKPSVRSSVVAEAGQVQ